KDRQKDSLMVDPEITSGDYLLGFLLGTRQALHEKDRESITIYLEEVTPFSVGVLIALFERAVGLYASLININAYHQPGVEAGKKAAGAIISLQTKILEKLRANVGTAFTVDQIAEVLESPDQRETIFVVCEHLAENRPSITKTGGPSPATCKYGYS
ncbi:MAG TPA: glucose-6-phosphate isomerase, partial [Verrucomicrobiae bacterium]